MQKTRSITRSSTKKALVIEQVIFPERTMCRSYGLIHVNQSINESIMVHLSYLGRKGLQIFLSHIGPGKKVRLAFTVFKDLREWGEGKN